MITYDYQCEECKKIQEVTIETSDISGFSGGTEGKGRGNWSCDKHNTRANYYTVDQGALSERIKEERFCECGGRLKKLWTIPQDPMFIKYHKQRFK